MLWGKLPACLGSRVNAEKEFAIIKPDTELLGKMMATVKAKIAVKAPLADKGEFFENFCILNAG